jgi:hypothetical protein
MSDETTSDKSPRSPVYSLADALEYVAKMHKAIGRATVKPEGAAIALGYKGLNGAALTMLGTLSQYGLIERSRGNVAITPLAVRIMHPTGDPQRRASLREAALSPKVFKDLAENFGDCTADVLTSHLVQNGFNVERARRAASVFVANKGFADVSTDGTFRTYETRENGRSDTANGDQSDSRGLQEPQEGKGGRKVLANYSCPLGLNEAIIKIEGEKLSTADFDELIDFIEFCKKQFERRAKAEGTPTNEGED